MLRKLLTLLALCAGLVAAAEPARAAVGPVESVHLVERAALVSAARSTSPVHTDEQRSHSRELRRHDVPKAISLVRVPTVRVQVDRARE